MSASSDVVVTSDAAGSLGFGAYFKNEWFSGAWGPSHSDQSIAYKELFRVVVASHIWGPQWHQCHILFRSDNEAVVHILTSRMSKIPSTIQVLLHLLSVAAQYNFTFTAIHLPGIHNSTADALSHFCWQEFQGLAPEALPHPVPICQQL